MYRYHGILLVCNPYTYPLVIHVRSGFSRNHPDHPAFDGTSPSGFRKSRGDLGDRHAATHVGDMQYSIANMLHSFT